MTPMTALSTTIWMIDVAPIRVGRAPDADLADDMILEKIRFDTVGGTRLCVRIRDRVVSPCNSPFPVEKPREVALKSAPSGVLCSAAGIRWATSSCSPPPSHRAPVVRRIAPASSSRVVAGGREPVQWFAYPHHQILHTLGALRCCDHGGCWKARTVPLGDGDAVRDANLCVDPVRSTRSPKSPLIPTCMAMVTPTDVTRAIERFHERGANPCLKSREWRRCEPRLSQTTKETTHEKSQKARQAA